MKTQAKRIFVFSTYIASVFTSKCTLRFSQRIQLFKTWSFTLSVPGHESRPWTSLLKFVFKNITLKFQNRQWGLYLYQRNCININLGLSGELIAIDLSTHHCNFIMLGGVLKSCVFISFCSSFIITNVPYWIPLKSIEVCTVLWHNYWHTHEKSFGKKWFQDFSKTI